MAIEQERLLALIEYAQKSAAMNSKHATNVASHLFCRHENGIAKLPGIHLNVSSEDSGDEVWLIVNRLHEQKPPDILSHVLQPWIDLTNNPTKEPVLKKYIETQQLIELGLEMSIENIEDRPLDPKQLVFLDSYKLKSDVDTQLEIYISMDSLVN